jgi:hypothetical protein
MQQNGVCRRKVGRGAAKQSAAPPCEEWPRKVASPPACRQKGFQFEFKLYALGDPSLGYSDEDIRFPVPYISALSLGTGTEYRYITIVKVNAPKYTKMNGFRYGTWVQTCRLTPRKLGWWLSRSCKRDVTQKCFGKVVPGTGYPYGRSCGSMTFWCGSGSFYFHH